MRKLIESTLVSLDGVIEAPERWASFDAEDTALSLGQLGLSFAHGISLGEPAGSADIDLEEVE